jgi:hypothetical protein
MIRKKAIKAIQNHIASSFTTTRRYVRYGVCRIGLPSCPARRRLPYVPAGTHAVRHDAQKLRRGTGGRVAGARSPPRLPLALSGGRDIEGAAPCRLE